MSPVKNQVRAATLVLPRKIAAGGEARKTPDCLPSGCRCLGKVGGFPPMLWGKRPPYWTTAHPHPRARRSHWPPVSGSPETSSSLCPSEMGPQAPPGGFPPEGGRCSVSRDARR